MIIIGKTYPHDIVINIEKVRSISPSENYSGKLNIIYKDWSVITVDSIEVK